MLKKITVFMIIAAVALAARAQGVKATDNVYGDYMISTSDKIISLDLENATLLSVVKLLSQQTGFNFVANNLAAGKQLTLYLDKTPLKEAMDVIFKSNNLAYDYYPEANIFVIKETGAPELELVTKAYPLKYVRIKDSALTVERAAIGSGGGTAIMDAVSRVLSDKGKIVEDSFTNSLIVTDVLPQFKVIEQVINSIDRPMPQVVIEVEMLDVTEHAIDQLGINWPQAIASMDITGQRASRFPFGSAAEPLGGIQWAELKSPGGVDFSDANIPVNKFPPNVFTLVGAELALDMLRSDSTTKSLARPKIMTMSNESAEVNLTIDEVVGVKNGYDDQGNITSSEAERAETGTKLRVTPQVNPDTNEVTLALNVFNREAKDSGILVGGDATKNIEERSTKSIVRLDDGETLMIGGLVKHSSEDGKSKVPFFSNLPIFGGMFRHRSADSVQRELLIFLTPHVILAEKAPGPDLKVFAREQSDSSKTRSVQSVLDKIEDRRR